MTWSKGGRVTVFKIRACSGQNYAANCVIVLTDKPQKPIPWDAVESERAKQPSQEKMFCKLGDLVAILGKYGHDANEAKLLDDFVYIGWAYSSSSSQRGLTDAGKAAYERFRAVQDDGGTPTETGTLYSKVSA